MDFGHDGSSVFAQFIRDAARPIFMQSSNVHGRDHSLQQLVVHRAFRRLFMGFNELVQKDLGLTSDQEILGYLYIGTEVGKKKKVPSLDIDKFVQHL